MAFSFKHVGDKLYATWEGLPTWAKGIIGVGTAAGLFFVGKKIYQIAFPSDAEKRNKALVNAIDSEIANWQAQGQTPSFADSQYLTYANTIYDGMRYAIGDDYGTVESTMEMMNNNLDVAKLLKAFGSRQNYDFGIPVGDPKDLFTFVESELGDDFLGLTGYRVTNINSNWSAKGITYQV